MNFAHCAQESDEGLNTLFSCVRKISFRFTNGGPFRFTIVNSEKISCCDERDSWPGTCISLSSTLLLLNTPKFFEFAGFLFYSFLFSQWNPKVSLSTNEIETKADLQQNSVASLLTCIIIFHEFSTKDRVSTYSFSSAFVH